MAPLLSVAALDYARTRRRWILILAAAGITGYSAYKTYIWLSRVAGTLLSAADAASSAASATTLVSSDIERFLLSDSDDIPLTLKQISKIATSDELCSSLAKVSEALTAGVLRGQGSKAESGPISSVVDSSSFADLLLDKLFSTAGSGFASIVAASFARSLALSLYSMNNRTAADPYPVPPTWIQVICGSDCRKLIGDYIQQFVSTATTVYLDKTMYINIYDEMFAGLTNPKHASAAKDMLVSVCNGVAETSIKTWHEVVVSDQPQDSKELVKKDGDCGGGGWVDEALTTVALPKNRDFVLDVTGRVAFETVRSVLEFMADRARRGVGVAMEEMVERGMEVVRYASAKSMVITTICVALCLHVLVGTKVLMPIEMLES